DRVLLPAADPPAARPIARSTVFSDRANSCRRAFERPARDGEDEITPELGAVDDVFHRIDGRHGRLRGGAERLVARRRTLEPALGLRDAPRIDFDGAERERRLGDLAAVEAIKADRRGKRKISGTPAEFVDAAPRAGRPPGQAHPDHT